MIPSVSGKSPQKIITASDGQIITMVSKTPMGVATTNTASTTNSSKSVGISPTSKVIIRQQIQGSGVPVAVGKPIITQQLNMGPRLQTSNTVPVSNVRAINTQGSKFQYVRLVTTSQPQTTPGVRPVQPIAPAMPSSFISNQPTTQMKITLPVQTQVGSKPNVPANQRILLPATPKMPAKIPSKVPIKLNQQSGQTVTVARLPSSGQGMLTHLPQNMQGMTIIQGPRADGQSYALVPTQYVAQQSVSSTPQRPVAVQPNTRQDGGYVPIASLGTPASSVSSKHVNGASSSTTTIDTGNRPRKPCNCTKSQCLKLYCDCFANGEFCHNCNCNNCANNLDHEEERSRAIKQCLDRNPTAFHPKIGKGKGYGMERRHNKGCNCKRSGCLKNYCECYEAKILCSNLCKCCGCKNFEESPDRKTLMHLADAAEVRVQQQAAVKTKLSSQIQDLRPRPTPAAAGERLPYTFMTKEVVEATCSCLLAQAEEAERTRQVDILQERMVLEEFGRCLMQVIQSANKTKAPSPHP